MLSFLSLAKNSRLANSITSIAVGKFDGLHLGHQELLKKLDAHGAILCIEQDNGVLLPKKYRSFYVKYPMFYLQLEIVRDKNDKEFVGFLQSVLPNLKYIVVGYDFRFGKNRFYYPFDLSRYFKGEVIVVNEVFYKKLSVHSGLIKELLLNGNVKQASKLLGRLYGVRGGIIKGQGLGKRKLYATINIQNDGFLLPQEGVYAGFIQLGAQSAESKKYPAVIFVGNRLSTDKSFSIEGHLLGVEVEVKEREAEFYFARKIRNNRKFENLESLKEQICYDINEAYRILKVKHDG
ncbi:bifunctional riboflavin kinase/FAD synthetase [Helicobacter turcicus]|uniref:Riboflavin biosynthesis protein n=1 Tax=Helicobacter turcicus TaxID=2867412 RepID=A0ABS7JKL3_9HELI|nr:bifunctional riboflavin kinase/FAD synthetase [Helicobacter turcicus]MBX7489938.1 bifunctional riboflavin kinase/FAD synthetase [Helicobacter turcicus]MBX7544798.1 bifunctional riboflavin kinase/FAD synthetase [Helicobacter turcicus]